MAEQMARQGRIDQFWRMHRLQSMLRRLQAGTYVSIAVPSWEVIYAFSTPKAEVDAAIEQAWREKISDHAHAECYDHFFRYGDASYSNRIEGGVLCVVCGNALMCAGERRLHAFRELDVPECRQRGIYHAGNCYHVSLCTRCDFVRAVDSSG